MATLTPASAQAIARLRAYRPPPSRWNDLPLSRRAAVLILLFPDRKGDLRVVLTMRASTLKTYAGQAALPGGKSDSLDETPWQTARREAYEEIGLPLSDAKLPPPFRVEHLCQLPMNLARTELGVRPCVAFLSALPPSTDSSSSSSSSSSSNAAASGKPVPSVEDTMIPRLDAKEVAAVFTAPFHNFLKATDEYEVRDADPEAGVEAAGFPAEWYRGQWTEWHESQWRMHNFYVPVAGQTVTRPKAASSSSSSSSSTTATSSSSSSSSSSSKSTSSSSSTTSSGLPYSQREPAPTTDPLAGMKRFRVFGMTARILVDAARVAYVEEPEFEHNSHFGDEEMVGRLLRMGRLGRVRKSEDELTREDMVAAAKI